MVVFLRYIFNITADVLCAFTAGWILYHTDYSAADHPERRSLLQRMSSKFFDKKIDEKINKGLGKR